MEFFNTILNRHRRKINAFCILKKQKEKKEKKKKKERNTNSVVKTANSPNSHGIFPLKKLPLKALSLLY